MPEVTGYTTQKVDALVASAVVGANIDPSTGVLTLTLHDGTTVNVGSVLTAVPSATTAVSGTVELATDVETLAGTDTTRAVTPFSLAALTGDTTRKGIVELATQPEVVAGTDQTRAVTPFGLSGVIATTTARGLVELATQAETLAGTDAVRAATPLGVSGAIVELKDELPKISYTTGTTYALKDYVNIYVGPVDPGTSNPDGTIWFDTTGA